MFEGRKTTLKPHKDGRLMVEIERTKADAEKPEPKGWLAKKTKWVRVFETVIRATMRTRKSDATEYDTKLRAIKTPAQQFLGWVSRTRAANGSSNPAANVKMLLQNLGNTKDEAECIMGGAIDQ